MSVYAYEIDNDDRIRVVSPGWVRFAEENHAAELQPDTVVGQSVWRYISDAETRLLYERLFASVREDRRARRIPFRCDGPYRRRFMRLTVSWLEEGARAAFGLSERGDPGSRFASGCFGATFQGFPPHVRLVQLRAGRE